MNRPWNYNVSQNSQSGVNLKDGSSTVKESDDQEESSSHYKESVDKVSDI